MGMLFKDSDIVAVQTWWMGVVKQITKQVMAEEEKRQARSRKKAEKYLGDFKTTMEQLPDTRRHPGRLFWAVLLVLVLYQMLGVFFGMDIADAGFYLTFYDNIFTHPASVEYNQTHHSR